MLHDSEDSSIRVSKISIIYKPHGVKTVRRFLYFHVTLFVDEGNGFY